ncbi:MAG TPA: hypothetical protein VFU88_09370 [Ktedonobacterales bacterium]|nr:hypothetical protein [Ktedonobacterales bacterium]
MSATPPRGRRHPASTDAALAIPPAAQDVEYSATGCLPNASPMDQADSPDPLDDALTYVETHDGDVLQIELERGPLTRAGPRLAAGRPLRCHPPGR